jgi:hypothetical protein
MFEAWGTLNILGIRPTLCKFLKDAAQLTGHFLTWGRNLQAKTLSGLSKKLPIWIFIAFKKVFNSKSKL